MFNWDSLAKLNLYPGINAQMMAQADAERRKAQQNYEYAQIMENREQSERDVIDGECVRVDEKRIGHE